MNSDFTISKYSFQYNFSIHQTIDSNIIQKFYIFLEYYLHTWITIIGNHHYHKQSLQYSMLLEISRIFMNANI